MERKRITEATKGVGKPQVGGPFNLLDQDGKPFSGEDLKGKYALVSLTVSLLEIREEELHGSKDSVSISVDLEESVDSHLHPLSFDDNSRLIAKWNCDSNLTFCRSTSDSHTVQIYARKNWTRCPLPLTWLTPNPPQPSGPCS
jgi:hypothetical protein